jgi:hypothetical protein
MEHVQRGMRSSGFAFARTNPLQEPVLVNFHRAIRDYLGLRGSEQRPSDSRSKRG